MYSVYLVSIRTVSFISKEGPKHFDFRLLVNIVHQTALVSHSHAIPTVRIERVINCFY